MVRRQLKLVITMGSLLTAVNSIPVLAEHELATGVTLFGSMEIEASYEKDFSGKNRNDISFSEMILGLDAKINEWASSHLALYYKEHKVPLEVDVATITLSNPAKTPFYLTAGQMYLPFGNFTSAMVSDPLTLDVAETREAAIQVGFKHAGFYGSMFVFNGNTNNDGKDKTNRYGGNFGFSHDHEKSAYDLGFGYLSDIGDTWTIGDALKNKGENYDQVGGLRGHAIFRMDTLKFVGTYLGALESFSRDHFDFNGEGATPAAWHTEVSYTTAVMGKETTFAVGYQGTHECLMLELPTTRYLATTSVNIFENTYLSLEYAADDDYSQEEGGTGNSAKIITLQLAIEF